MSKKLLAGIFTIISTLLPFSSQSADAAPADNNPSAVTFPGLTRYVDLQAFFSVLMRGTPKKRKFELNGVTYSDVFEDDKEGTWAVAFADMPDMGNPPYDPQKLNQAINEQPNLYVDKIHGKMQSLRAQTKFGHQFREIEGRIDSGPHKGGRFRTNWYLSGKRMFIVSAEGKADWVKSPQTNAFFNSFEVPGGTAAPKMKIK